jgi:hypothetical protein
LHRKLAAADMTPYFCLSWILTWFAHDVRDTALVKRLFDAFLASHAMLPTYVAVAMLVRNRAEILECENDFSLLHQCLCGLPKNSSRVGWKYRPGEGYVTDEEHGGTTVSTASSLGTADFLLVAAAEEAEHHGELPGNSGGGAPTALLSSISSLEEPSVSFEKLIQEAIGIMEQIPPSRIASITDRAGQRGWFGSRRSPSSSAAAADPPPLPRMLQEPPFWAVREFASRTASAEEGPGRRRSNGRTRRSRSRSRPGLAASRQSVITDEERLGVQGYLSANKGSAAVIAAGYGSGRGRAAGGGRLASPAGATILAVAVVAVAVGVMFAGHKYRHEPLADAEAPNSSALLVVVPLEPSGGEILAVSALVESLEAADAAATGGVCPGCTALGEHASSRSSALSVLELEPDRECSALVSLQAPVAPQEYHLTGLEDYRVLFSFVKRQSLVVRRLVVLAYSRAIPYLAVVVKLAGAMISEEYLRLRAAFKDSPLDHHFRRARAQAGAVLARGKESAKQLQRRVSREASWRLRQSAAHLETWRERARPHLRDLSRAANGLLRRIDGAASGRFRSLAESLGNSAPGKRLGEARRLLAASPVARRAGGVYRNLTASPAAAKVVEASFGIVLGASLTSLYR